MPSVPTFKIRTAGTPAVLIGAAALAALAAVTRHVVEAIERMAEASGAGTNQQ